VLRQGRDARDANELLVRFEALVGVRGEELLERLVGGGRHRHAPDGIGWRGIEPGPCRATRLELRPRGRTWIDPGTVGTGVVVWLGTPRLRPGLG